jgi:mono/diheme cytochrome c family protein
MRTTIGLLCLAWMGCNQGSPAAEPAKPAAAEVKPEPAAAAPAAPQQDDKAAALEIFQNRCTPCHGAKGAGDGPASAGLNPKPANFTSPEWQAKVTDEHIEQTLTYGGAAVGKSPAMPANPDLDQRQGVVKALRAHIRSLKKQ